MVVWLGVFVGIPVAWILIESFLPEHFSQTIKGIAILAWLGVMALSMLMCWAEVGRT